MKPKRPLPRRSGRRTALLVVPILVFFAAGTVWLRLSIVRTSYAINQMESRIRAVRQSREELILRQSALRSPRRLEGLARGQFGLATPRTDQVIHMGAAHPVAEPEVVK
jgi:cell division protein FtsL